MTRVNPIFCGRPFGGLASPGSRPRIQGSHPGCSHTPAHWLRRPGDKKGACQALQAIEEAGNMGLRSGLRRPLQAEKDGVPCICRLSPP